MTTLKTKYSMKTAQHKTARESTRTARGEHKDSTRGIKRTTGRTEDRKGKECKGEIGSESESLSLSLSESENNSENESESESLSLSESESESERESESESESESERKSESENESDRKG
jgi:hypothetical protein